MEKETASKESEGNREATHSQKGKSSASSEVVPSLHIDILSLFPDYFKGPFDVSILKRAQEKRIVDIHNHNIRDFSEDKWGRVDDRPFGGGPGMVMMAGPCARAIRSVRRKGSHVIHLSPQGEKLTAAKCRSLAGRSHLVLLCGHYEGVDQRVIDSEVDEEISIGDYVLTNGCLAAIVLVDALCRFVPGVLGNEETAGSDSFEEGIFDGPQYTRPIEFENRVVPPVLRGGNHQEIKKWRQEQALRKTESVRPELVEKL